MINKIHLGNSLEILKDIPNNSVDLIVTDPPYQINNTKAGGKSGLSKSFQKVKGKWGLFADAI